MMRQEPSSGYLDGAYRLFHLRDQLAQHFRYHYHDFDKVIFFLSGSVTYMIEGRAYFLQAGDVLLIPHHHIHYPMIDPAQPYERVILWLSPEFLAQHSLQDCFVHADKERFHLLQAEQHIWGEWMQLIQSFETARICKGFAQELLEQTYCLQLLISLNRATLAGQTAPSEGVWRTDPKVETVLTYINANLSEDLSLSALSGRFYLSESYLMHRFKDATGCTVHQYVQQKRLINAADLIRSGTPVMKAAVSSGFQDYSAFLRAFQKKYHLSPKQLKATEEHSIQPVGRDELE